MTGVEALEWAKDLGGPVGVIAGIAGKGIFDRRVRKLAARKAAAEAEKTDSETSKIDAESAKVITEVALALVTPLKQEIAELRDRVDRLEGEKASVEGKLRRAIAHIKELRYWIELRNLGEAPPPPPLDLQL